MTIPIKLRSSGYRNRMARENYMHGNAKIQVKMRIAIFFLTKAIQIYNWVSNFWPSQDCLSIIVYQSAGQARQAGRQASI